MASGTISLGRSLQTKAQIVWSSVSNGTAANTSTVTASLQVMKTNGYTTGGTWTGYLTIGGTKESYSYYGNVKNWVTIKTSQVTVSHNPDGSGTCYLAASVTAPTGTTQEGAKVSSSATVTLDTIPRQAILKSAPPFNDEDGLKITYTNPLGGAVPSLMVGISLDSTAAGIPDEYYYNVDKYASEDTIQLLETDISRIRTAVTSGSSRTVWVYLRTRIDETYYYSPLSTTFSIKNPNPTINSTIVDVDPTTIALTGDSSTLVRYQSDARVTIGAASKQASISMNTVTNGTKTLTSDGTIENIESNNFVFTVIDSRGNSLIETITPQKFIDYVKLTCSLIKTAPTGDGTMTVKATGNYFNGSFGAADNTISVYYRYKISGGSYPDQWTPMTVTKSGNTYTATANLSGLDYQTTYVFQAYAEDKIYTYIASAENVVKSTPIFDWGESDFNFNVPVNINGSLAASGFTLSETEIRVDGDLNTYYPVHVYSSQFYAAPQYLYLKKNLGSISPAWEGNHSGGASSITMGWSYRFNGWDGNGVHIDTLYKHQPYANLISHIDVLTNAAKGVVLWLRGGGATYTLASNMSISPMVYLQTTNIGSTSYPHEVSPRTDIGNAGVMFMNRPLNVSGILDIVYPIGSYYISNQDVYSPAYLFGGIWERIEGRFLYGCHSTGTVGATGATGAESVTLSVNQIPSHNHSVTGRADGNATSGTIIETYASYTTTRTAYTGYTGGGEAHNNMPPYVNVAIWRRTG